jgi:hypothetical protein
VARSPRAARLRTIVIAAAALTSLLVTMAIAAPAELTAARQRFAAIDEARSNNSIHYRLVESRRVLQQIYDHPIVGAYGLRFTGSRTTGTYGSLGRSVCRWRPYSCC